MTRNVSRSGLMFYSVRRYAPGERVEIRIQAPSSPSMHRVAARVVHTHVEPPELGALLKYVTAVEFEEPLSAIAA